VRIRRLPFPTGRLTAMLTIPAVPLVKWMSAAVVRVPRQRPGDARRHEVTAALPAYTTAVYCAGLLHAFGQTVIGQL
jgi:hypothetical protein